MMEIRTAPNRKETQSIKWIWAYIQDSKTYTESICSRISQHEDRISDTKDRLHVLIIRKSSCGTVPWDINPADSRSCKQLIGKPGIQFSGRSNHPANLRSSVQFPPTKKRKNKKTDWRNWKSRRCYAWYKNPFTDRKAKHFPDGEITLGHPDK